MALDLAHVVGADDRAHFRLRVERIADRDRARPLGELGDEVLGDRALQQQARAGVAAFAGIEVGPEQASVERRLEIGVGEDICGFLPPSSIDTFFSVADAAAIAARPTAVEPVNEIMSTRASLVIGAPTSEP